MTAELPWLALYIASMGVCRTLTEWRALFLATCYCHLSLKDKLTSLVCSHVITAAAAVTLTGLITSWLPLMGAAYCRFATQRGR